MEVGRFLINDFLMLTIGMVGVVWAFARVAHVTLLARSHTRHVHKVIGVYEHLLASSAAAGVLDILDNLPADKRHQISDIMSDAVRFSDALIQVGRAIKPGRAVSPALVEIEALEAEIAQPQAYHAVQLHDGWAVAYVEQGAEKIAWQGTCPITARIEALRRNIAAGLAPDPVEGLLKVDQLRRELV